MRPVLNLGQLASVLLIIAPPAHIFLKFCGIAGVEERARCLQQGTDCIFSRAPALLADLAPNIVKPVLLGTISVFYKIRWKDSLLTARSSQTHKILFIIQCTLFWTKYWFEFPFQEVHYSSSPFSCLKHSVQKYGYWNIFSLKIMSPAFVEKLKTSSN